MSARSLNKVMIIGNLTRDPELRYTPNGSAVCTFGVATNRSYTPSDGGETQEDTEFHRVVAWGKLAEICNQLLFKGRKVYIDGRLQTRKWTGQDGMERTSTEIVTENMIALSPPRGMSAPADDGYYNNDGYSQGSQDDSGATQDDSSQPVTDDDGEEPEEEAVEAEEAPKSDKKSKKDDKAEDKKQEANEEEEVDVDDIPF